MKKAILGVGSLIALVAVSFNFQGMGGASKLSSGQVTEEYSNVIDVSEARRELPSIGPKYQFAASHLEEQPEFDVYSLVYPREAHRDDKISWIRDLSRAAESPSLDSDAKKYILEKLMDLAITEVDGGVKTHALVNYSRVGEPAIATGLLRFFFGAGSIVPDDYYFALAHLAFAAEVDEKTRSSLLHEMQDPNNEPAAQALFSTMRSSDIRQLTETQADSLMTFFNERWPGFPASQSELSVESASAYLDWLMATASLSKRSNEGEVITRFISDRFKDELIDPREAVSLLMIGLFIDEQVPEQAKALKKVVLNVARGYIDTYPDHPFVEYLQLSSPSIR